MEEFEDFKNKTTMAEEKVQARGHLSKKIFFFSSSTVNLMPVNDVGATPKKHTRAYTN